MDKILFICVIIILLVVFKIIYNIIIKQYFRNNDDNISYNYLKTFINVVSINNNFMNYGFWYKETNNLLEANKNLVNLVLEKSGLKNDKNKNILDVGCGYGVQDIEWSKIIDKSCKIKAIDISEEQIKYAINVSDNKKIMFEVCDVKNIYLKYKKEVFDIIFSLESAFHYNSREEFFKDTNKLLSDDGKFIITDIMLKNDYNENNMINKVFIYFFSDFLQIPKKNLISVEEWDKQLSSHFIIEENIDITENTFEPYYDYFMKTYSKNSNLPVFIGNLLSSFFCKNQPFAYKIVTCRKRKNV